jgi:hypothetical protein
MNWKHLFWIIPMSLVLGGFITLKTIDWWLDESMIYLTEKATEKLYDGILAWEETPLSDKRIFYEGEFCYEVDKIPICPKRNASISSGFS